MSDGDLLLTAEQVRALAQMTNGEVWALLTKPDRSEDEDHRMVHAAHASLYHWLQVGTAVQHQRGVWLIAHVYTVLAQSDEAVRYAERCMRLTRLHADGLEDFDLAFANLGLARAYALAGRLDEARHYQVAAAAAGEAIANDEDRAIFLDDLAAGPWYGLG